MEPIRASQIDPNELHRAGEGLLGDLETSA